MQFSLSLLILILTECTPGATSSINSFLAPGGSDSDCPLFGPEYPPPSKLSQSCWFATAIQAFEKQVANDTTGLAPNDTAWAVAFFSAKEDKIIYERYHTPPLDMGVKEVNRDSIFRLASVSKIFTVWTLLRSIGDCRFNDPISYYVPELANQRIFADVLYDDIEHVRWEDVTLGELASQSSGIARDGKSC